MKRETTMLVLCGLFLFADALLIAETVETWAEISVSHSTRVLTVEVVAAVVLAGFAAASMMQTIAERRRMRVRRRTASAIRQPLRRLFAAVWP